MALTYPVDLNKKYFLIRKSTLTVLEKNFPWPNADGSQIILSDPDLGFGLVVQLATPAYDPDTQKLEPTETLDVPSQELRLGYQIVPLSQAELDAVAERQADEATAAIIQQGIIDLKNGTGTAVERLVRVERACVYLLKKATGIQ